MCDHAHRTSAIVFATIDLMWLMEWLASSTSTCFDVRQAVDTQRQRARGCADNSLLLRKCLQLYHVGW